MINWLQKYSQFSGAPCIYPVGNELCSSSHQETESISHPLNQTWSCDLFGPIGCGGHDAEPRPQEALQLLLGLLEPCCHTVNKPGLAFWRMRDHVEQNQAPNKAYRANQ